MDTMTVDVKEAQVDLSRSLALAVGGNKALISENQESVVQLVPIRKRHKR